MTGDGPRRTCVGCRRVAPATVLVRVRRDGPDLVTGTGPGRGAWLCAEHPVECLDRATRREALARALRSPIASGDIERLRAKLEG